MTNFDSAIIAKLDIQSIQDYYRSFNKANALKKNLVREYGIIITSISIKPTHFNDNSYLILEYKIVNKSLQDCLQVQREMGEYASTFLQTQIFFGEYSYFDESIL